jgi:hypothetical protein
MTRHTPPRPVDIEALFPELIPLRRHAVRLHPRPGSPSHRDSSVGGPLLWPADEPWPTCSDEHIDLEGDTPVEDEVSFVPVVQVHRGDAPGIPFPPGRDLLQVLWCPSYHAEDYCPRPEVRWRTAGSIGQVAPTPAPPAGAPEDLVPNPCVVHPEQVTEYPCWDLPPELDRALEDRFAELARDTGWEYQYHLSTAPGIKLGGYPGWSQDPNWPDCGACGRRMEHLLTVESWEYDGASWRAWLPVEEQPADGKPPYEVERSNTAQDAAGLMLGDAGGVYIFECRTCPARPTAHRFDCS